MSKTHLAKDIAEIVQFAQPLARQRGFELDQEQQPEATWSTREHGNVGDEKPGAADMKAAREVAAAIEAKFANARASFDTCDEWTNLTLRWFPTELPPRKPSTAELNQRLQRLQGSITTTLMAAGRITMDFHVYVPSTGQGLVINPTPRKAGNSWHIQIFKSQTHELKETVHFQVGRHSVELETGSPNEILRAFNALAPTTDNYNDVHPYYHILAVADGYLTDPWDHRGIREVSDIAQAYKFQWTGGEQGIEAVRVARKATIVRWRQGYPPEAV
jgi:hypothetical protein